jgi:hypothetical protein
MWVLTYSRVATLPLYQEWLLIYSILYLFSGLAWTIQLNKSLNSLVGRLIPLFSMCFQKFPGYPSVNIWYHGQFFLFFV